MILRVPGRVCGEAFQVSVLFLDHDRLPQRRPGRPLSLEHPVQLLEGAATGFDAEHEPYQAVDQVQPDKDEVVVPVDGFECDCGDVGVVEVRAVGQDDVLCYVRYRVQLKARETRLTIPIPLARMGLFRTSAQYVAVNGV